ncbi:MAG: L-threonylcarbamoyladenylate synthase [Acidimicrobiales bacterium]
MSAAAATVVTTDVDVAARALAEGRLVAFPTETVYGLGADATDPAAVGRIFETKGRPRGHPLIVHLASTAGLDRWVDAAPPATAHLRRLAEAFWPGPLTVVVARSDLVAAETVGGRPTVGLRVPDHPVATELLRRFGGGVAAPSANRFGKVSPTTAAHVVDDLDGMVDIVLDGGPTRVGIESTIVEVADEVTLLRPGAVTADELSAVLGLRVVDGTGGVSRAPGMLRSHYAPEAAVELVTAGEVASRLAAGDVDATTGIIAPVAVDHHPSWWLPATADGYAARLYGALREADRLGLHRLLVVPPAGGDLLDAVLDRLTKAAAPRPLRR